MSRQICVLDSNESRLLCGIQVDTSAGSAMSVADVTLQSFHFQSPSTFSFEQALAALFGPNLMTQITGDISSRCLPLFAGLGVRLHCRPNNYSCNNTSWDNDTIFLMIIIPKSFVIEKINLIQHPIQVVFDLESKSGCTHRQCTAAYYNNLRDTSVWHYFMIDWTEWFGAQLSDGWKLE